LAINQTTLKTRAIIAVLCVVIGAIVFDRLMMNGFLAVATKGGGAFAGFAVYLAVLAAALGISWATLNFSARFVLKKRFPQLTFALQQKIGKTGISMLAGISVAFVGFLLLAPVKPLWLGLLFH
jgi:hypothetical protein